MGNGEWRPLGPARGEVLAGEAPLRISLLSADWLLRRPVRVYVRVRVDTAALAPDLAVASLTRAAPAAAADLPELAEDPLAAPMVVREGLATWLLGILLLGLALAGAGMLVARGVAFAAYALGDELGGRTVTVVIQSAGAGDLAEVRKNMTGRRALSLSRGRVGVSIGDDPDAPEWRPQWLKVRRLFRPWADTVQVRLTYPVGNGRGARRFSTTLAEGARGPVPLNGMRRAEAYLEVRRRGGRPGAAGAPARSRPRTYA